MSPKPKQVFKIGDYVTFNDGSSTIEECKLIWIDDNDQIKPYLIIKLDRTKKEDHFNTNLRALAITGLDNAIFVKPYEGYDYLWPNKNDITISENPQFNLLDIIQKLKDEII